MPDLSPQSIASAITALWGLMVLVCLGLCLIDRSHTRQRRRLRELTDRLNLLETQLLTSHVGPSGGLLLPIELVGGSSDGLHTAAPLPANQCAVTDLQTGQADTYVATGHRNPKTGRWIYHPDPAGALGLPVLRNTSPKTTDH